MMKIEKEFKKGVDEDLKVHAKNILKALELGQILGSWEEKSEEKRKEMADKLKEIPSEKYFSKEEEKKWNNILTDLLKN